MSETLHKINSTETLLAAIESATATGKFATDGTVRRHIMRRARSLGRFDLIPDGWKNIKESEMSKKSEFSAAERSQANAVLSQKASDTGIDISLLRSVYVRGVSEFAQMPNAPTDVVSREEWAQARVNSFIRAHNGDPATRKIDHDLLNP
jgi:hypothetical protein